MRIANSQKWPRRTAVCVGAAFLIALGAWPFMPPVGARADQPALTVPPPPMMMGALPPAANVAAAPAPGISLPGMNVNSAAAATLPEPGRPLSPENASADISKNISAFEDKASDNAKGVVKHLDNSADAMTLEDLNAARQAVARLDAMIDVEKHLAELDKVRSERGGHSSSALANAIPASALTPPPAMAPAPMRAPPEREKSKPTITGIEISRIIGTDGTYSAVLKMPGGETRSVRVGDTLSDHVTVRWISASTVLIEENGATHSLRIKNVDAIYSAMR